MVFGDSSSSSLWATRKGAFYTYHSHFPLQNSFPFTDTVLLTFQNAQKLRLMSVHTKNTSADVDGGRRSGTENKPRTRTRQKKKKPWISNHKNAELVKQSFSTPHRLAGSGELSATINRQNPIMGNLIKTYYRTAALKRPTKHTSISDLQQLQETAPLKSPAHSAVTEQRAVCVAPSRHALLQACDSLVLCFDTSALIRSQWVVVSLTKADKVDIQETKLYRGTAGWNMSDTTRWIAEEVLTRLQRTQTGCFLHFTLRCRQSEISTLNNICRWPTLKWHLWDDCGVLLGDIFVFLSVGSVGLQKVNRVWNEGLLSDCSSNSRTPAHLRPYIHFRRHARPGTRCTRHCFPLHIHHATVACFFFQFFLFLSTGITASISKSILQAALFLFFFFFFPGVQLGGAQTAERVRALRLMWILIV